MIRTLLVDDELLVRSGLRMILEADPGIEVVGEGILLVWEFDVLEETLAAFDALIKAGKVRAIGTSTFTAHEIVGSLVRKLLGDGRHFDSLTHDEWRAASELFEQDVAARVTPRASVAAKRTPQSTAPPEARPAPRFPPEAHCRWSGLAPAKSKATEPTKRAAGAPGRTRNVR